MIHSSSIHYIREPDVSVYIPTYNRLDTLRRALQSLKVQSYPRIQVLVCEDPSGISCKSLIDEFRNCFSDLVFLRNSKRSGPCVSRNRMIDAADGKYITGLDDDDVFESNRISDFVNCRHIESSAFLCSRAMPIERLDRYFPPYDPARWISFSDLKRGNVVGNQIFIDKKYLIEAGKFDPSMPAWQDYDVWFRVAGLFGQGYKLNNSSYRVDLSEASCRISTSSYALQGFQYFVKKHRAHLSKSDLAYLQLRDYENRNVCVRLKDVLRAADGLPLPDRAPVIREYLKNYIGSEYPWVKRLALASPLYSRRNAHG